MIETNILNELRSLQVLVVIPESEIVNSLILQLMRIGCSVRQIWPIPENIDCSTDVIFTEVNQDYDNKLKKLIDTQQNNLTLISIIQYESPTILSQLIENETHGVISAPFSSHDILPCLVVARRNSRIISIKNKELLKSKNKISKMQIVNKAKILIMKNTNVTEEQAHKLLAKNAMKLRVSISEVASELINNYE
ncbi:MAG: ANTAR domain-containing protein [Firmicutes bacterium]|nr:ANTAR domain-containing protein [Bacillota bacterium]